MDAEVLQSWACVCSYRRALQRERQVAVSGVARGASTHAQHTASLGAAQARVAQARTLGARLHPSFDARKRRPSATESASMSGFA